MSTNRLFPALLLSLAINAMAYSQDDQKNKEAKGPAFSSNKDKASYAIGFNIGTDIKNKGLDLDPKFIAEGIAAALSGKESVLSQEQIQEVFIALEKEIRPPR